MPIQLFNVRKFSGSAVPLAKHVLGESRDSTSEVQLDADGTPLPAVTDLLPAVGETRPYQVRLQAAQRAIAEARALPTPGRKPQPCIGIIAAGPPAYGAAEAWDQDQIAKWAVQSVQWFKECSPHSVITAAALHQDETRPHVHILAVARAESGHVGWGRILPGFAVTQGDSRRLGPQRMREMQTRYHTEVAAPFGLRRDRGEGPRTYVRDPDRRQAELDRAAAGRYSADYIDAATPEVQAVAALGAEVRALTGPAQEGAASERAQLALVNGRLRGEVGTLRGQVGDMESRLGRLEWQVKSLTGQRDAALGKADQANAQLGADQLTIKRQGAALDQLRDTQGALTSELVKVRAEQTRVVEAAWNAGQALDDLPEARLWGGEGPGMLSQLLDWIGRRAGLPAEARGWLGELGPTLEKVGACVDRARGALATVWERQEPRSAEAREPSASASRIKPSSGRW